MTNAEARCNKSLRPRKPEGSLGRTAQDVHLDSHTAPELWRHGEPVAWLFKALSPSQGQSNSRTCFQRLPGSVLWRSNIVLGRRSGRPRLEPLLMQRSAFLLCHIDTCRITSAFRLQDEAVFCVLVFNACHTAYFQLTAHTCLQVLHWHSVYFQLTAHTCLQVLHWRSVYFQLTAHTCLFLSDIVSTFSLQHTLVCSCGYFQVTVHTHTHTKCLSVVSIWMSTLQQVQPRLGAAPPHRG